MLPEVLQPEWAEAQDCKAPKPELPSAQAQPHGTAAISGNPFIPPAATTEV